MRRSNAGRATLDCTVDQAMLGIAARIQKRTRVGILATYLLEGWRRLPSAKVGQCPCCIPQHSDLRVVVELGEKRHHGIVTEDQVPALRRVSRNVSKSPDGLEKNTATVILYNNESMGTETNEHHNLLVP